MSVAHLSESLARLWESQRERATTTRTIKIRLVDGSWDVTGTLEKTTALSQDFHALKSVVLENEACFLVFRLGEKWMLISWCPTDASVLEKVTYGSTAASDLRGLLDVTRVTSERQYDRVTDFNWAEYMASRKPASCLSEREQTLQALTNMENQARDEQRSGVNKLLADCLIETAQKRTAQNL
ncbi:hypothetical protein Pelo_13565 [Pelomyxa schiedti]|nr:hypothetical protein Pelo_13565 [Pelomyxa schiedti]